MIVNIPIHLVIPNTYQRRSDLEYGDIETLAKQIAAARSTYPATGGLMQLPQGRLWAGDKQALPSDYNRHPDHWPDGYSVELAYGHRRARAWQWLAMNDPAYADKGLPVDLRMLTDREMLAAVWRENEQRENVSDFTRAALIEEMITLNGWTQQQAADHLGMSRSAVANLLRLLKFPDHLRQRLTAAGISQRQALALIAIYEHDQDPSTGRADNLIDDVIAHPDSYPADTIRALAEELKAPAPIKPAKEDRIFAPVNTARRQPTTKTADPDPADLLDGPELEITDCPQCGKEIDLYEWIGPGRLINELTCDQCGYRAEYEMRKDREWRLVSQTTPKLAQVQELIANAQTVPDDMIDNEIAYCKSTNGNGLTHHPAPVITVHPDLVVAVANIQKIAIDPRDVTRSAEYCYMLARDETRPGTEKILIELGKLLECLRNKQEEATQ